jgi:hypothetical protein
VATLRPGMGTRNFFFYSMIAIGGQRTRASLFATYFKPQNICNCHPTLAPNCAVRTWGTIPPNSCHVGQQEGDSRSPLRLPTSGTLNPKRESCESQVEEGRVHRDSARSRRPHPELRRWRQF